MDDLAFVLRAERGGQLRGGPAEQRRQLHRVVVDQAAGDRRGRAASTRSTGSPAANSPSTAVMPAGSSDLRRPPRPRPRPWSRCSRPRAVVACASQNSRAARVAAVRVEAGADSARRPGACAASAAAVSTTGMPAPVAIRAASTLVTMPPVPTPARPAPIATPARSLRAAHLGDPPGARPARVAGVERVHVGEQHQQVGVDQVRRPARRAGRCRRSGSRRWRRCRSR